MRICIYIHNIHYCNIIAVVTVATIFLPQYFYLLHRNHWWKKRWFPNGPVPGQVLRGVARGPAPLPASGAFAPCVFTRGAGTAAGPAGEFHGFMDQIRRNHETTKYWYVYRTTKLWWIYIIPKNIISKMMKLIWDYQIVQNIAIRVEKPHHLLSEFGFPLWLQTTCGTYVLVLHDDYISLL